MPLQLTTTTEEPPAKRVCTHATAGTTTATVPLKWIFCFESLGDKKLLLIGQTKNLDTALLNVNRSHAASGMQFRFRCAAVTLDYDRVCVAPSMAPLWPLCGSHFGYTDTHTDAGPVADVQLLCEQAHEPDAGLL